MRPLPLHRFFLRFALAGASVFAWVFLFQYFYIVRGDLAVALAQVVLLYALSSTVTVLLTPVAARIVRHGVRRTLVYALICAGGAFVIIGSTFEGFWGATYSGAAIAAFAVLFGTYRALYWVPYEVEVAAGGGKSRSIRGEILIALAPAFGGLFIAAAVSAPVWIFYIGAGVVLLSAVPIVSLPDIREEFVWGYRQTFHELLSREHRTSVTIALLEGISGAALLIFWPLAIFLIIGWSYGMLGIVLSVTFLAAILLRAPVRALMRRVKLQDSRILTTVLTVTPWLFRVAVATPLGVVLADSYFYTTAPRRFGIDPLAFEQVSDGGSFIDEYTALKEMALNIGRLAVCVLGAAAALLFSVPIAFVVVFGIAALASAALALRTR